MMVMQLKWKPVSLDSQPTTHFLRQLDDLQKLHHDDHHGVHDVHDDHHDVHDERHEVHDERHDVHDVHDDRHGVHKLFI